MTPRPHDDAAACPQCGRPFQPHGIHIKTGGILERNLFLRNPPNAICAPPMTPRPHDDAAACPQCEKLRDALSRIASFADDGHDLVINDPAPRSSFRKIVRAADMALNDSQPSPLQSVITWVPVSERLPEDERSKLIVVGPYILMSFWDAESKLWTEGKRRNAWNPGCVTHWAEMPTPPTSEEREG
jgi:hypothetical protein